MNLRKIGMLAMVITVMASCKKDTPTPTPIRELGDVVHSMSIAGDNGYIMVNGSSKIEVVSVGVSSYSNGYFVTNEGNFGTGNGSISYVSENGNVENNIFSILLEKYSSLINGKTFLPNSSCSIKFSNIVFSIVVIIIFC